jgi:rubrerythrin
MSKDMKKSERLASLNESRTREREQARFYRALSARAEERGEELLLDRLNALHADEQHHLSRLTARVLELGGELREEEAVATDPVELARWEEEARERETREVEWYERLAEVEPDPVTRALFVEILESERHHARELAGKWMSA